MAEDNKIETPEAETNSRRKFVTTAAQVAVTAPAVGLLLSAATKPAAAQSAYQAKINHILDDYTFGNDHEDIDTHRYGSNFNPRNGQANQDDVLISTSDDLGEDDAITTEIVPA